MEDDSYVEFAVTDDHLEFPSEGELSPSDDNQDSDSECEQEEETGNDEEAATQSRNNNAVVLNIPTAAAGCSKDVAAQDTSIS